MTAITTAASEKERELVITRAFDVPRELAFEAWTKPEHLIQWWGPNEFTLPFCEIDFRVGGKYRFCMRSPDGINHWVWGEYREIVRPEQIVMTWNREDADGNLWSSTVATVTFLELGGKTAFKLHQAIFENMEYRDQHNGGWTQCLDRLSEYLVLLKTAAETSDQKSN